MPLGYVDHSANSGHPALHPSVFNDISTIGHSKAIRTFCSIRRMVTPEWLICPITSQITFDKRGQAPRGFIAEQFGLDINLQSPASAALHQGSCRLFLSIL
jgi:hypothetical protein